MPNALPPAQTAPSSVSVPSWIAASGTGTTYYGYCTIADVQLQVPDYQNNPNWGAGNNSAVAQCITEAALEMQNALELVYLMPYTGSDSVIKGTLSELNAKLATSMLYDRLFGAAAPDASTKGVLLRQYVMVRLKSIIDGEEQWGAPFHDAIPVAEHAVYPRAGLSQVEPNPNDGTTTALPRFSVTRSTFKMDDLM